MTAGAGHLRATIDPGSLAMYLICIALHGWLLALLVRDARRWRTK